MIPKLFLGFVLFLWSNTCTSQEDTLAVQKDTSHSVKKATLLSVVLPGAGQVYNHIAQPKGKKKAFWKVPLIYAGLGFTGYSLISNHSEVLALRDEYRYREANPGLTSNSDYDIYSNQSDLLILEQQSASTRDYSILAFVFIYALQVTDAAVEAHFVHYDISEDLSLDLKPWTYQNTYSGISLSFNFR